MKFRSATHDDRIADFADAQALANTGAAPSTTRGALKRRTLVAGAAWAVPAVMATAPVYAYTASGSWVTVTGTAVKIPGASCSNSYPEVYKQGYRYYMQAANPPGKDACIVVTSVLVGGVAPSDYKIFTTSNTVTSGCACAPSGYATKSIFVAANTTVNFTIDAEMSNSANTSMSFVYQVYNAATCTNDFPDETGYGANTPPTSGNCLPY